MSPTSDTLEALEEAAQGSGTAACEAAFQLVTMLTNRDDDEALARAKTLLLLAAAAEPKALVDAVAAVGDGDAAVLLLQQQVRSARALDKPSEEARVRQALARVLEHNGDVEQGYQQCAKALRLVPSSLELIELTTRLAIAAKKIEAGERLFRGLLAIPNVDDDGRFSLWRQLGTLAEDRRGFRDAAGAFEQALLVRDSKGLRRKLEALQVKLAVEPPSPELYPVVTVDEQHMAVTAPMLTPVMKAAVVQGEPIPGESQRLWQSTPLWDEVAFSVADQPMVDGPPPIAATALMASTTADESMFPAVPDPDPLEDATATSVSIRSPLLTALNLRDDSAWNGGDEDAFAPSGHINLGVVADRPEPLAMATIVEVQPSAPVVDVAAALRGDDAPACVEAATWLEDNDPRDARSLSLLLRALEIGADLPAAPDDDVLARAVTTAHRLGTRAIADVRAFFDVVAHDRTAYRDLWLTVCAAAPQDVSLAFALLADAARVDAPHGRCFMALTSTCDAARSFGQLDTLLDSMLRDDLWMSSAMAAERRQLVAIRLRLLAEQGRPVDARHLRAAEALSSPVQRDAVEQVRVEYQDEPAAERARWLSAASRAASRDGDEALESLLLTDLLAVRMSLQDQLGATAAARQLLAVVPQHAEAQAALLSLWSADPHHDDDRRSLLLSLLSGSSGSSAQLRAWMRDALSLSTDVSFMASWSELGPHQLIAIVADPALANDIVTALAAQLPDRLEATAMAIADGMHADESTRLLLRSSTLAMELQRGGVAKSLAALAVSASPNHLGARERLAELLVHIGDVRGAAGVVTELIPMVTATDTRARLLRQLAELHEQAREQEPARGALREALALRPDDASAWSSLRRLSHAAGDLVEVAAALEGEATASSGAVRISRFLEVAELVFDAEPARAQRALLLALDEDPTHLPALHQLLRLQARRWHRTDDVDAIVGAPAPELLAALAPVLTRADNHGADLPVAMRLLLGMALSSSEPQRAVDVLQQCLLQSPGLIAAQLTLARLWTTMPAAGSHEHMALLEDLEGASPALTVEQQVFVASSQCTLAVTTQPQVARAAALKLVVMVRSDARVAKAISAPCRHAMVVSLDDGSGRDEVALLKAIELDMDVVKAPTERSRLLVRKAKLQWAHESGAAASALQEALAVDPRCSEARELLLDLQFAHDDPLRSVDDIRSLVDLEADSTKRAELLLRLFRLLKKRAAPNRDIDDVLSRAMAAAPSNAVVLDVAERHYEDAREWSVLAALYVGQLRALDRGDSAQRVRTLEKLASVRRWELGDEDGALESYRALLAIAADHPRARADLGHLLFDMGKYDDAAATWRVLVERSPLDAEGWRGLTQAIAAAGHDEELLQACGVMAALGVASDEITRTTRTLRAPFPQWPRVLPAFETSRRRLLEHIQQRTACGSLLAALAPLLLPQLGAADRNPVRERIAAERLPSSIAMALRSACAVVDPQALVPSMVVAAADEEVGGGFACVPAKGPTILVDRALLKGGITPERAFFLGRACSLSQPLPLLLRSLDIVALLRLCEGWVGLLLSRQDMARPDDEARTQADRQRSLLEARQAGAAHDQAMSSLLPLLRNYVHARPQSPPNGSLRSLIEGTEHTANRVGLLLAADPATAFSSLAALPSAWLAPRVAVHELVTFALSPTHAALRTELHMGGLASPSQPLIELCW